MGEYFIQGAFLICVCQTWMDPMQNTPSSTGVRSNSLKFIQTLTPICDHCRQAPATLAHMFWFCPTLHGYWTDIFETMSEVVETIIEPVAITALFGTLSFPVHCPRYKADFVAFVTLLARRQILLHWKSSVPPTHS